MRDYRERRREQGVAESVVAGHCIGITAAPGLLYQSSRSEPLFEAARGKAPAEIDVRAKEYYAG